MCNDDNDSLAWPLDKSCTQDSIIHNEMTPRRAFQFHILTLPAAARSRYAVSIIFNIKTYRQSIFDNNYLKTNGVRATALTKIHSPLTQWYHGDLRRRWSKNNHSLSSTSSSHHGSPPPPQSRCVVVVVAAVIVGYRLRSCTHTWWIRPSWQICRYNSEEICVLMKVVIRILFFRRPNHVSITNKMIHSVLKFLSFGLNPAILGIFKWMNLLFACLIVIVSHHISGNMTLRDNYGSDIRSLRS